MKWTSIREKLPETSDFYLATIKSPIDTWVEEVGFDGKKWELPGRGVTEFVTHWMEKPKPAIEETKVCTILNGALSWFLEVDGESISFDTYRAAEYFLKHYEALGYTVIVNNSYWNEK